MGFWIILSPKGCGAWESFHVLSRKSLYDIAI